MTSSEYVKSLIRFVGNAGYGDLFPVFADAEARRYCIWALAEWADGLQERRVYFDKIVSLQAKGFVVGGMLAERLDLPFAPIAKNGRFHKDQNPLRELADDYSGRTKVLEVTRDHIGEGERILLVDDWFETGAQARTAMKLIEQCGATVVALCGIVDDTKRSKFAEKISADYPFYCVIALER